MPRSTGLPALALAAVLGMAAGAQAASWTDPFDKLVVYGDSLADPGNIFAFGLPPVLPPATFPPPPYFDGQFSNGPVFAVQLQQDFAAAGKTSVNYAVGAAKAATDADGIPDLAVQVGASVFGGFPVPPSLPTPDTLAVFSFGGNDIMSAARNLDDDGNPVVPTLAAMEAAVTAAVTAIRDSILFLNGIGLQNVVILGPGDVGQVPRFAINPRTGLPVNPLFFGNGALASAGSDLFDSLLGATVAGLNTVPDLRVLIADTRPGLAAIFADPGSVGIGGGGPVAPLAQPCGEPVLPPPGPLPVEDFTHCLGGPADAAHVFFDNVHPVKEVHGALADLVRREVRVAYVPLPAPALGLGAALLLLAGLRRGRARG